MSQHIKITYRRQSSGWHRLTVSSYGEIVASGSEKRKEDAMALAAAAKRERNRKEKEMLCR